MKWLPRITIDPTGREGKNGREGENTLNHLFINIIAFSTRSLRARETESKKRPGSGPKQQSQLVLESFW